MSSFFSHPGIQGKAGTPKVIEADASNDVLFRSIFCCCQIFLGRHVISKAKKLFRRFSQYQLQDFLQSTEKGVSCT